jgi:hypothetical protein
MIYLYCPDDNQPHGGIRKLYRHADVLNRHGIGAAIVHVQPGFRCSWFENQTPVVAAPTLRPQPEDILVVPEVYGPHFARTAPGIRKVVFNQNCYNTFVGYPIDETPGETPYLHPDIIAALTVSEDNTSYLRFAFPRLKVLRLHLGIDGSLFYPGTPKRRRIAFMPRRQLEEARQVFNILKFRGSLEGFDIVEISGLSHRDAARLLRDSAIFFSFSAIEGFGLPPAEAMASGCLTIGFHGRGGKEFFRPEFSWPVEFGDIEGYARIAEAVLEQHRRDPAPLLEKADAAAKFIAANYSMAAEEADIVACWRQILAETGPG